MNKKIVMALSLFIVAIIAMGTVSAFDLNNLIPGLGSLFGDVPDQNITLDGETFHIPGAFKENANISDNGTVQDYDYFKVTEYGRGYANNTKFINILISEYSGIEPDANLINYMNGTSKTINGTNGYLSYDGVAYTFTYLKGNKVITVQTDAESLIGRAIA